ncbi:MAG: type I-E CRISPR-associated protein Cas6/Cse3/CasE [Chloroflexi bacterium]|nr:type I-E CRISPR-associated protein Cas6/Cse3/CasE [Chloroflexota bacterium]
MYLSRLILNPRNRRVQNEMARPYELHRSVLKAFPDAMPDSERVLYRVDHDARGERLTLLVQSESRPDWTWAEQSPGYLLDDGSVADGPLAVKEFALALQPGQVLAFRLRANPTVKKKSHERPDGVMPPNGIRLGLVREEDQRAWLERKGQQHGFRVLRLLIAPEGMQVGHQPVSQEQPRRLAHMAVRFEGVLQVTDPALLSEAVRAGIGSAKSFGFGLLSLARLR